MWRVLAALASLAFVVTGAHGEAAAPAQQPEQSPVKAPPSARVPLRENFPWPEIAGIAVVGVGNLVLKAYEIDLAKARGTPLIGAPPGFDRAISNAAYQGPFAKPFLLHAPELVLTEVGPAAYAAYRGVDSLSIWLRHKPLLGSVNADHKLFAFAEAYTLTTVLSLAVKLSVGRVRPFEELHRYGSDPGQPKTTISFWSNQTADSFCFVTFVWRDFGDWLTSGPMSNSSEGARLWLGRVLPGAALLSAASFDGYSRIVDQRHWFSDVVLGAAVGGAIGYSTYAYHFDWAGQPRRRWGDGARLTVVPMARGASVVGTF
jgi:membrane-associated phospholipid phosphatase